MNLPISSAVRREVFPVNDNKFRADPEGVGHFSHLLDAKAPPSNIVGGDKALLLAYPKRNVLQLWPVAKLDLG
ncbi:MAG: hypothetical protein BJ554DRAFT_5601 [Olpidium bornovanus]|uniref:Uncharacterized protein n=1 Tax=Olpidium bornovanus TaxID=278681 RepID=A0A8H7ZYY2_9FUNG|nr:MAG: hypothetical protein BJ554DRAFT_5601 [Olpidium bornovanus]